MFFGSQWFHVTFSHSNGRFFAYFRVCHLLLCVIVAITTAFPCQLFARIRRIEVEEKHAPQHQNISPLVDCTYSYSPTTPSYSQGKLGWRKMEIVGELHCSSAFLQQ